MNPIEQDRLDAQAKMARFGSAKKRKKVSSRNDFSNEKAGLANFHQQRKIDQLHEDNKKKPKDFLVKQVVEWLRKQYDSEKFRYARMTVEEVKMGTQEKINIDQLGIRAKVSEHKCVHFHEESHTFTYQPKFPNVSCKEQLLTLLSDHPFGLFQEDVETCYLIEDVQEDVDELVEELELHREENKEEKKRVLFRTKKGCRKADNVDESVKQLWLLVGSELPKNPRDVETQLEKFGLKPIKQKEMRLGVARGRGRGKRGRRGRGRGFGIA